MKKKVLIGIVGFVLITMGIFFNIEEDNANEMQINNVNLLALEEAEAKEDAPYCVLCEPAIWCCLMDEQYCGWICTAYL